MLGLHPLNKVSVKGAIRIRCKDGSDLDVVGASDRRLRSGCARRRAVAMMIFRGADVIAQSGQEVRRIGDQIVERCAFIRSISLVPEPWHGRSELLTGLGVLSPQKCHHVQLSTVAAGCASA